MLVRLPCVRERIAAVRTFRQASKSKPTQKLAETPTLYHVNVLPDLPFLVVPKVSSERREYVPVGWLEPPTIPSDLVFVLQNATLVDFALLTSTMHMAWLRHVGGRLESRYRYSIGLVYNTFPTPPGFMSENSDLPKLESLAQAILDARSAHPGATLSDLYDPDLMPPNLRRAHQALDRAVDRLYRRSGFTSERERVEHLFMRYEKMRAPLEMEMKAKPKRRRALQASKPQQGKRTAGLGQTSRQYRTGVHGVIEKLPTRRDGLCRQSVLRPNSNFTPWVDGMWWDVLMVAGSLRMVVDCCYGRSINALVY